MSEQAFDPAVHIEPFNKVEHIKTDEGYIVWRIGTGGNAELLHIRAYRKREGAGRRLVRAMVQALKANPPYKTVFGFTRMANTDAQAFYRKLGFVISLVTGVYADGNALVFSQNFDDMVRYFDVDCPDS